MEKIRVLLVDDHEIVRQGLRTFLELQTDFEIAGEGANGIEAVAVKRGVRSGTPAGRKPAARPGKAHHRASTHRIACRGKNCRSGKSF